MSHDHKEEGAHEKVQRSSASSFMLGVVVFLAILLVGVGLYGKAGVNSLSTSPVVLGIADVFNSPIAKVNGEKVLYTDYVRDIGIVKKFYEDEAEGDAVYNEEEVSDQVLARLIANEIIGQVAKEFDVTVTKAELDQGMEDLLTEAPDPELAKQELEERFGWSIAEYKENVLYHILMENKVRDAFLSTAPTDGEVAKEVQARHILFQVTEFPVDPETGEENPAYEAARSAAQSEAQAVLDRIKNGEDFAELAKEFGSDGTAQVGGDLGWFGRGQMVPAFEEAVFALDAGELSDELVETQFGFHIVETTGIRDAQTRTLEEFQVFMDKKLTDATIEVLLNVHNPFEFLGATVDDGTSVELEQVEQ